MTIRYFVFVAALLGSVNIFDLSAAVIPYTENFDDETVGNTVPTGFTENTDAQWSVISGGISGNSYHNAYTTDNTASSALVDFSGSLGGSAATASNFTISTEVRFNAGTTGTNSTAGLAFLMDSGGNNGYFIDLNIATGATNNIRIVEIASGTGTVTTQVDQGTVSIGNVYTMTLTGTYADTNADTIKDLILSLTVTGTGMSGTPVTWTDTAGVKTGTYFGFRNRTASTDINVDFDNLSVVPEPSTYALVAGGIAFLAFLRRRKD